MSTEIDYLITGGTGLIGRAFINSLPPEASVVVLSRQSKDQAEKRIGRKVEVIANFDQIPRSSKIRYCLNLSGEPIVDWPWTTSRKNALRHSRIDITRQIAELSNRLPHPFECLVSGSAIGYYPASTDTHYDENGPHGVGFAAELCRDWEDAASEINTVRRCYLRTGIVLSDDGGMLDKLSPSFKFGLGAILGSGEQAMSWIHLEDAVAIIHFLFETPAAQGPVNNCAPAAATNREFSDLLAETMHRPRLFAMPGFVVRLMFGERSGLLLDSQTIIPQRLIDLGYSFKYPDLRGALSAIYG